MKTVIVIVLLGVLASLAGAGVFMLRKRPESEDPDARDRRMARALALRVALSVALFALIMLGWWLGWIRPGGLPRAV